MRTTDFSRAPRQARAAAMVVAEVAEMPELTDSPDAPGARASGSSGSSGRSGTSVDVRRVALSWARRARRTSATVDGAVWQTAYRLRGPERVRGVIAYLETAEQALALAGALAADGRGATVRTRVLVAEESGYSNGVWRAEGPTMAHVERFTPVTREVEHGVEPPLVADPRVTKRGASSRRGGRAGRRPRGPVRVPGSPVDAHAMFIGATRYRGLRSWLVLSREWFPMVAKMRRMHGYLWHAVYWEAPFTLGTLAFFETRDDLLVFARLPEHRRLMQWITRGTRNGTGGYIRLHVAAEPRGTTDGGDRVGVHRPVGDRDAADTHGTADEHPAGGLA
ncbi:hypothetical protein SANBI_000228 [Sanguibacter sp. 4.1]|uniref:DUF4188 domain-containing protein n=1 Tax=Sanguibacter biliveldensis TaxID=3030830 RepID=A0AAF0Z4E0_9MICO|nr:hypothetical protein [Sanguibacter sp. 4.1]WPF82617.1 hypothetical protein SANBI_000228 [Sanguibacter sp. 4.1]